MNHQEVFIKASKLGIPIYSKPTSFMAKVTIMDDDEVPETPEVPENPDTPINATLPPKHPNIVVSNNVQLVDGKYDIYKRDVIIWKIKLVGVTEDTLIGESKFSVTNLTNGNVIEEILNFVNLEDDVTITFDSAAIYELNLSIPNVDELNWQIGVQDVVTPSTATIKKVDGEVGKEMLLDVTINDIDNKWDNIKLSVIEPNSQAKQLLSENVTTGIYRYTPNVEGLHYFILENNNVTLCQLVVDVAPQPVFSINVESLTLNPINQSNIHFRVNVENGDIKYKNLTMFAEIQAYGNIDFKVADVRLTGTSDIDYMLTKSEEHIFKVIGTLIDDSGTEEVWRETVQVADLPQPTITSTIAENDHFRITTTKNVVNGDIEVPVGTEVDYRIIALSDTAKNNIIADSSYYKISTPEGEQTLLFDEITSGNKAARTTCQYNTTGYLSSSILSDTDGQVILWNTNII